MHCQKNHTTVFKPACALFQICAILFFTVYHDIFSCLVMKQIRTGGLCNMNFIWPRKNSYCPWLRLGQYEFFLGHIKFILHSPPVRICIILHSVLCNNCIIFNLNWCRHLMPSLYLSTFSISKISDVQLNLFR